MQGNKPRHRIVPIILITLGIPIALGIGFLLVVNVLFHDEPAPNDTALMLPDVAVDATTNAQTEVHLLKALVDAADPQATEPRNDARVDAMLNGESWDDVYASTVLQRFSTSIQQFRTAAKKAYYQDPTTARPGSWTLDSTFDDISTTRFVGKLVALDGLRAAKSGDVAGGLAEADAVARLGYLIDSGQGSLIQYLVGGAVKNIGLQGIRQIALQTTVTASQAKSEAAQLESYRDSRDGLVKAMQFDYMAFKTYLPQMQHLDTIYSLYNLTSDINGQTIETHGPWFIRALDRSGITRFYYWPNQTWRFAIDQAKERVALAQVDCATGNLEPQPTMVSTHHGYGKLFEPNAIGKSLHDIGQISYGGLLARVCNASLAISATQTTLAIRSYQAEHGSTPAALSTLIPNYLASIPVDPYANAPMQYSVDKKMIYSIGSKREDLGGSPVIADWQQQENPSFATSR